MNEIQVSILCMVYNHEKYLRKCLDGFVMQQGVTFEIVIHDDASTDRSADIIREYEAKYPDLFKPIYQTENQYSKNVDIFSDFLLANSSGNYLALCEGDDYWTDPYKLKKQVDALEANPQCSFCTHTVQVIRESGEETEETFPAIDVPEGFISRDEFFSNIWLNDLNTFQTSSYFIRTSACRELCANPPEFVLVSDIADLPALLYFTFLSGVCFINEKMSCYRGGSNSSWVRRMYKNPIPHCKKMIQMYTLFSEYTDNTVDTRKIVDSFYSTIYYECTLKKQDRPQS